VVDNTAGSYLQNFSVDTQGTTDGQIAIANNISVDDDGAGTAGSVTLAGDVRLSASMTIDTEQGNTAGVDGGAITLTDSNIAVTANGFDITLDTATTATGRSGGSVILGTANIFIGGFINDITIDTSGNGGAGSLTLNGDIFVDTNAADTADFTLTGGGDVIVAAITVIDTENGNDESGGAINLGTSNIYADAAGYSLTLKTDSTGNQGGDITFGLVDDNAGANNFLILLKTIEL